MQLKTMTDHKIPGKVASLDLGEGLAETSVFNNHDNKMLFTLVSMVKTLVSKVRVDA